MNYRSLLIHLLPCLPKRILTISAEPSQPAATIEVVRREPESISADALCAERLRIAQRLHDTICQELTGFYLIASGAALKCRTTSPDAAQKLDDLAGKIQRAGANLGAFVSQLRVGRNRFEAVLAVAS